MAPKYVLIASALVLALVAGLAANRLYDSARDPQRSVTTAMILPESRALPAFSLLDHDGRQVGPEVFAGHWNLVFFGFTHCPDICPMTLQVLSTAQKQLAEAGHEVLPRIVLVSVDPERDTPEKMREYLSVFGEGHVGLTGELDELRKLTADLGIYFEKRESDGENYAVDHSAVVLVIDPQGRFHALFGAPHDAASFTGDLPLIMASR